MAQDETDAAARLAEVLEGVRVEEGSRLYRRCSAQHAAAYAAALLPLVRGLQAEELEAAAHRLDDGGDQSIEVALGGAAYVHRVLCDRAAALRVRGEANR